MSRLMLVKVDYSLALNKREHPSFASEGSPGLGPPRLSQPRLGRPPEEPGSIPAARTKETQKLLDLKLGLTPMIDS
jgi:hypothetical protein